MKNICFLLLLSFPAIAFSQVITGEELREMVVIAQDKSVGAHESIVQRINEDFAKSIWGKTIRFNETNIVKFFKHPSGEKVEAGVDLNKSSRSTWAYSYDQKTAADLLIEKGVRVSQSYNTLWIKANQVLVSAVNEKDGNKITLELYCPHQELLELLRTGQKQSIEFLITGYYGSASTGSKIHGVLTKVHEERPIISCSNGHEFDKVVGYKFCPTCGEPLK